MLTTDEVVVAEAVEGLSDQIEAYDDALDDLESSTEQAKTIRSRKSRLASMRSGLEWHLTDGDWDDETAVEVGAMTAGEEAMMHREATGGAGPDEMRLWFVAASLVEGPFVGDTIEETFNEVAGLHPGAVKFFEAKANGLATASGDEGNRSGESSPPTTEDETPSTPRPDSTS